MSQVSSRTLALPHVFSHYHTFWRGQDTTTRVILKKRKVQLCPSSSQNTTLAPHSLRVKAKVLTMALCNLVPLFLQPHLLGLSLLTALQLVSESHQAPTCTLGPLHCLSTSSGMVFPQASTSLNVLGSFTFWLKCHPLGTYLKLYLPYKPFIISFALFYFRKSKSIET